MGLFESLRKNIINGKVQSPPTEVCPNCWGRQEYGGAFYEAVKAEGIDTNNIDAKKGWIQAYAETHLTGIELREQDSQLICNSCQMTYDKKE
jgi:protein-arginine kinase activator protein McsA